MERVISLNTFQARQARYRGLSVVPGIAKILKNYVCYGITAVRYKTLIARKRHPLESRVVGKCTD